MLCDLLGNIGIKTVDLLNQIFCVIFTIRIIVKHRYWGAHRQWHCSGHRGPSIGAQLFGSVIRKRHHAKCIHGVCQLARKRKGCGRLKEQASKHCGHQGHPHAHRSTDTTTCCWPAAFFVRLHVAGILDCRLV